MPKGPPSGGSFHARTSPLPGYPQPPSFGNRRDCRSSCAPGISHAPRRGEGREQTGLLPCRTGTEARANPSGCPHPPRAGTGGAGSFQRPMNEWDEQLERVNRAFRRGRLLKVVLWLIAGLLIALVLASDDPDKYGSWLVGAVMAWGSSRRLWRSASVRARCPRGRALENWARDSWRCAHTRLSTDSEQTGVLGGFTRRGEHRRLRGDVDGKAADRIEARQRALQERRAAGPRRRPPSRPARPARPPGQARARAVSAGVGRARVDLVAALGRAQGGALGVPRRQGRDRPGELGLHAAQRA